MKRPNGRQEPQTRLLSLKQSEFESPVLNLPRLAMSSAYDSMTTGIRGRIGFRVPQGKADSARLPFPRASLICRAIPQADFMRLLI
jgi:hypothetical protein